jgi:hypothetical protein
MSETKFTGVTYTDNHTLFIKCTVAYEYQLEESLTNAIKNVKHICPNLDTDFKINMVTNGKNEYIGVSYVRVNDPRVYHMLLGKNPDGSERTEEKLDVDWKIPTPEENEMVEKQISQIPEPEFIIENSWGEYSDLYDEYIEKINEIRRQLHQKKTTIKLDPLTKLNPYPIDNLQKERYRVRQIVKNQDNPDFSPDSIAIPEELHFEVLPAMATKTGVEFIPYILKCTNIPHSINAHQLKSILAPYVSDSKSIYHWNVMGTRSDESFPYVYLDTNRVASIIFDNRTRDAQFALFLIKKLKLANKVCWFSHCYVVDKDVSNEITKMSRPYISDRVSGNQQSHHQQTSQQKPQPSYQARQPSQQTQQRLPQTHQRPSQTQPRPTQTQTQHRPTQTQQRPTQAQTQQRPTQTQQRPSQTQTQQRPTQTQQRPSQTQTQQRPTQTQQRPSQTQTQQRPSQTQTQQRPSQTQTQQRPTQTQQRLSTTQQRPSQTQPQTSEDEWQQTRTKYNTQKAPSRRY